LFLKCSASIKLRKDEEMADQVEQAIQLQNIDQEIQTLMTADEIQELLVSIGTLEKENNIKQEEIEKLLAQLKEINGRYEVSSHSTKGKVQKLESQNSVLKEKSNDVRKENDMLVTKLQTLQKRLSMEVRVSVSEYCEDNTVQYNPVHYEDDNDETFYSGKTPSIGTPESGAPSGARSPISSGRSPSGRLFVKQSSSIGSRTISIPEDFLRNEEKRFEEAAEKIMRLEQRIVTLQNANNLNSCATCRPLRSHVMKIERQLLNLVQERKGQLEELYELKQEALSSAVGEKDAHLAWLEVSMSRDEIENVHTKSTVDRLRRERRELLHRMKEENENRMKLLSSLDDNSALFIGNTKITSLGALGESYLEEVDSGGLQSTSSLQSISTGGELGENVFPYNRADQIEGSSGSRGEDLPPPFTGRLEDIEVEDDNQSTKSC